MDDESMTGDICILKMNLDSYEVEEEFVIKDEHYNFAKNCEICYDPQLNIMYFITGYRIISYDICTRQLLRKEIFIDDITNNYYDNDEYDYENPLCSSVIKDTVVYIIFIYCRCLRVMKMGKDMSFTNVSTLEFSEQPIGIRKSTNLEGIYFWIFFTLPTAHYKRFSFNCDSHDIRQVSESNFTLTSEHDLRTGNLVTLPSYVLY